MTDPAALQKLVTWLSPAFPVGAFAWSAGLETAIADRRVTSAERLENWIGGALAHGGIRTDAILLAHAHRAADDAAALEELADLSLALTGSKERWMETTITADSYAWAMQFWPSPALDLLPQPCPYPIAVGALAAAHDIGVEDTLLAWLTATVHGQISVAVRLVPLGQSDGLRVLSALEPRVAALAATAATATLADLGAIAYAADIAQMRHETLEPRIFRS
ncbi:MAG: Urease accessory protein UreF [Devosia sp.]|uniref:urease accessory protein UreF n=1 Tax=Devosia sp. TaxID=1871048 RepID=UPI00262489E1|nr:urease accessory UreF family protein [Devosia sp.]MDB5540488.1 Urease accessory protein UreF [Devosia sp.]